MPYIPFDQTSLVLGAVLSVDTRASLALIKNRNETHSNHFLQVSLLLLLLLCNIQCSVVASRVCFTMSRNRLLCLHLGHIVGPDVQARPRSSMHAQLLFVPPVWLFVNIYCSFILSCVPSWFYQFI